MVLRSSVGIEIQDNFLEESYFKPIRDYVLDYSAKNSSEFNWFMGDVVSDNDSKKLNYVQFNHLVFCYNQVYSENFYNFPGALKTFDIFFNRIKQFSTAHIKLFGV